MWYAETNIRFEGFTDGADGPASVPGAGAAVAPAARPEAPPPFSLLFWAPDALPVAGVAVGMLGAVRYASFSSTKSSSCASSLGRRDIEGGALGFVRLIITLCRPFSSADAFTSKVQ
jgi:hypothetical protein